MVLMELNVHRSKKQSIADISSTNNRQRAFE